MFKETHVYGIFKFSYKIKKNEKNDLLPIQKIFCNFKNPVIVPITDRKI